MKFKHRRQLHMLPPSAPLCFFAIDILDSLPQTKSGNQFVVIIIDRYSEMPRAVPTPNISLSRVAYIFFNHSEILYGISDVILSDNDQKFVSKSFYFIVKLSWR